MHRRSIPYRQVILSRYCARYHCTVYVLSKNVYCTSARNITKYYHQPGAGRFILRPGTRKPGFRVWFRFVLEEQLTQFCRVLRPEKRMSATGFGICGQKNSYRSTTKCGNWVEDRCVKPWEKAIVLCRHVIAYQGYHLFSNTPLAVHTPSVIMHTVRRIAVRAHRVSNNLPLLGLSATYTAATHNIFLAARIISSTSDERAGVRAHFIDR